MNNNNNNNNNYSNSNSPKDLKHDHSFAVQIICRYYSVCAIEDRHGKSSHMSLNNNLQSTYQRFELQKITRVWTIPFKAAVSKSEFSHGVQTEVWNLVVLRGVVADFHEQMLESFGGPRPSIMEDDGKFCE